MDPMLPPHELHRPSWALPLLGVFLLAACNRTPPPPALTAEDLVARADTQADAKDYAGAIADYKAAIALQPDYALAYYDLAVTQYEKNDFTGAIDSFSQAIAHDPQNADAYLNRGVAKFELQDYPAAIADYNAALAINPDDTAAIYSRALAQRREGDFDAAFADYDHAIALDPNYWRAYNGRATAHNAHGDFELAIPDYDMRIKLAPEGAEYAWFQRTLLLRRLGRPDEDALKAQVLAWPEGWPKTVGLFLIGRIGPDELLRLAADTKDPQTQNEQLCEANYYVGITDLLTGRKDEAKAKFTACIATGVYQFLESLLSHSELARMQAPPAGTAPAQGG
jgi:lipoprotein NlpI